MGYSVAYDKTKDPVQLLAVICLGLPIDTGKTLTGWTAAYTRAMTRRKMCPIVSFSFAQLEALRAQASADSTCTPTPVPPVEKYLRKSGSSASNAAATTTTSVVAFAAVSSALLGLLLW